MCWLKEDFGKQTERILGEGHAEAVERLAKP